VGDEREQAAALTNLGWSSQRMGEYRKALEYYALSRPMHAKLGDKAAESQVLSNIGVAHYSLKEFDLAAAADEQAVALCEASGDPKGLAGALHDLALAYGQAGKPERTAELAKRGADIYSSLGLRAESSDCIILCGHAMVDMERYDEAIQYFEQALVVQRELQSFRRLSQVLGYLADVHEKLGNVELAADYRRQAEEIRPR
jgi:tetratricopeptide (TPR) repeat protein